MTRRIAPIIKTDRLPLREPAVADWLQRETRLIVQRIGQSWTGPRSFVPDDSPSVSFDDAVPDFFWLAAQGGYWIMMALGRCLPRPAARSSRRAKGTGH